MLLWPPTVEVRQPLPRPLLRAVVVVVARRRVVAEAPRAQLHLWRTWTLLLMPTRGAQLHPRRLRAVMRQQRAVRLAEVTAQLLPPTATELQRHERIDGVIRVEGDACCVFKLQFYIKFGPRLPSP